MSATISARILALIAQGKTVPEAVDAILGAGMYALIASDVYELLRS